MKTRIDKFAWYKVYTNLAQKDIAEKIGVKPEQLSRYKKEPYYEEMYEKYLEEFKKENWEDIARLSKRAIKEYDALFDRIEQGLVQDSVVIAANRDILDRTGYKEIETQNIHFDITPNTSSLAKYIKDNYED